MSETSTGKKPDRQARLELLLADYLRSVENSQPLDRSRVIAENPDLAEDLQVFFRNQDSFGRLAEPLKAAADAPTLLGVSETAPAQSGMTVRYFGDYELLDEIARGGMGVVFRARQVTLNRIVAVKMILAGSFAGPEDIERFHTEAEAAAQLDHPGIVPIYEIGQHESQHYFAMGLIEGQSLSEKVAQGPLPVREAAEIVKAVAEAVQYAHDKGIIHRDLKPSNILLDPQGKPRVTDFGLAKLTESGSDLTGTGQILGTPSFMPPEQAAGKVSTVGRLSDVYALGAILYCLLTGRPPFQAATPLETLMQVQKQEPVPPRQLNSSTPLDLNTIALKCLEKDPALRFGSAQDVADELQRFLNGEPIVTRPISMIERSWRSCKRRPLIPSISVAVIVTSAIAGVLYGHAAAVERTRRAQRDIAAALVGSTARIVLADWEYPMARSHANIRGGSSTVSGAGAAPQSPEFAPDLYVYSTPDSLESVWGHYTKLAGIDREFKPGNSFARSKWGAVASDRSGSSAIGGVLQYTGDPSRPSVRSATIVVQRPVYTVTVFITRSKDEDRTHISMVVENKSAQSSR